MGFIAEFNFQTSLLMPTLQDVPDMVLYNVDLQLDEESRAKTIFWASGDNFAQMEQSLKSDPTVDTFYKLIDEGNRHMYRVTCSEKYSDKMMYPYASRHDIVFLDVTTTIKGTQVRARVPSREALHEYRNICREHCKSFQLSGIYDKDTPEEDFRFGLTQKQYEALILAYEQGYYSTPRETNLEKLSDELGISRQAFANRLNRGYEQLIANSLA